MSRITLLAVPMFALALIASPAVSSAAANKLLANATVKSVSATSLTVTASGKDTTFAIDRKTNVVGKGIGTKTAAKGGKASIVDLVSQGDLVSVTYQAAGATMHASKVEVAPKATK